MNIKKLLVFSALLLSLSSLKCADAVDQAPKPNKPLTKYQAFKREACDLLGNRYIGNKAVDPETEAFVRAIIAEMGMEGYNIEIRAMRDNACKKTIGRIRPVFADPAIFFPESELSILFIDETHFSSASPAEKKFLIKKILIQIKKRYALKALPAFAAVTPITFFLFATIPGQRLVKQTIQQISNSLYSNADTVGEIVLPIATYTGLFLYALKLNKDLNSQASES